MQLFALHAADGTPILVTDSREAAVANAMTPRARNRQRALERDVPDATCRTRLRDEASTVAND